MPAKKPLSEQQIKWALEKGGTNKVAARLLNVDYRTYQRYAKLYFNEEGVSLWHASRNRGGKGVTRFMYNKGQFGDLNKILSGMMVDIEKYSIEKFKDALIRDAIFEDKCSCCGFNERRVYDAKVPLLINFLDNNKHNWKRENLQFLCYNCYFLMVGNVFTNRQLRQIEADEPDYKSQQVNWEMDEHTMQHFRELGLIKEDDDKEDDFIAYNK